MKKIFTLMAAAAIAVSVNAQSLRGDVNKDNNVDISDVNAVISIICGSDTVKYEEAKYITPYYTNNEDILGTWTSTTGTVTFNEDGTTDSKLGAKYQYRPLQGRILYFDAKDKLTAVQSLMDKTDEYIILCDNNSNTFTYYYKNGLPPVMVESITLSETSLTLGIDDTKTLTATVLPENADNKEVTWASSNPDVVFVSQIGKIIPANYGTATITATAKDGSGVVGSCEVTVSKPHEYVDLGLPSGTLWATTNVGADNPEDAGLYFAWGETTGYTSDTSDGRSFNWSSYKWMTSGQSSWKQINKYTFADIQTSAIWYNNGTFVGDGKTELESADDAATVNWGADWKMPTHAQQHELINSSYTTTTWTTQNGVKGRLITSKSNGNSIFLPAAGCRSDANLSNVGSRGDYWSGERGSGNSSYAWGLSFNSSNVNANYCSSRDCGGSVRAVRAASQN